MTKIPHTAHVDVPKPPAATIGSPGTSIVSVQSSGGSHLHETASFLSDSNQNGSTTGRDHIPPLWSFETSYSLFGAMIGSPRMQHEQRREDSKENVQVLQGSWLGRKKDKEKERGREGEKEREKSAEYSRSERSKSVDPPSRAPYSATYAPPPPPILSSSESTLASRQSLNLNSRSTSNGLSTPPTNPRQLNPDSDSVNPPSSSPQKNKSYLGSNLFNPHDGGSRGYRPPSPAGRIRTRHPPSSFNPNIGYVAQGEKKRRPTTSPATSEQPYPRESFLGDVFSLYGMAEGHTAMMGSFTSYAPSHSALLGTSKAKSRKETPAESLKRRMKEVRTRGFTIKNSKRYHSIPRNEAPYTRDYEHQTVDLDEWLQLFEFHLAKKWFFFPFSTPPTRVLDLGCGTGSWIVHCAREWKDTTFVGFDLVTMQPDLTLIGEHALASRIEWVVGNFLKPLPFADGEFDFVHVKRIARGVPENKWESLLDEITRVLKDGGAFEMVEEDLFFPGSVLCESKNDSSDEDLAERDDIAAPTTTKDAVAKPSADARIGSDLSSSLLSGTEEDGAQSLNTPQTDTSLSTDTTSSLSENRKSRSSIDMRRNRKIISEGIYNGSPKKKEEVLFHPVINPILNPHDHSILETVYNELHASRFINLQPLSLLSSMLVYHFKDVYTHERAEILFPNPNPRKKSEPSKRPVSFHVPSVPFSPLVDPAASSTSRRKSYHSKMVSPGAASQPSQPPEVLFRPINTITSGVLRLPNEKWRFDERILSMHLSLRVNNVLACAEEMWEFIQGCQKNPRRWKNTPMATLSGLIREEWDDCLIRFRLDMQDKIALADLLRVQFPLGLLPAPEGSDRKLFDEAAEKWKAQRRQNDSMARVTSGQSSSRRPISCSLRIFIARKE